MFTFVVYAANTQLTPDDPALPDADRWSMTDAPDLVADPGATSASVLPDGVLRITDPDLDHRRVYARYDAMSDDDDAIFEISCRVVSAGDNNGVAFGFIDARKNLEVGLLQNQVAMFLVEDGAAVHPMDTTDMLHTYRIVKLGSDTVHVSVDGVVVLGIAYDALADRTLEFPENQRQVLATSGVEASEWDIAYACYGISSGLPIDSDPETVKPTRSPEDDVLDEA